MLKSNSRHSAEGGNASWVETTARPPAARCRPSTAWNRAAWSASSAVVGSSASHNGALLATSPASATRRFCPADRKRIGVFCQTVQIQCRNGRLKIGASMQPGYEAQGFARRFRGPQRIEVAEPRKVAPPGDAILRHRGAIQFDGSGGGAQQPGQHSQQAGFTRSVRAAHDQRMPRRERERKVRENHAFAAHAGQTGNCQETEGCAGGYAGRYGCLKAHKGLDSREKEGVRENTMTVTGVDTLKSRRSLTVDGRAYDYFDLSAAGVFGDVSILPFSLKILLENLLRFEGWAHRHSR